MADIKDHNKVSAMVRDPFETNESDDEEAELIEGFFLIPDWSYGRPRGVVIDPDGNGTT